MQKAQITHHTEQPHRTHCGSTRPLTASEGHCCPVFGWDLISCCLPAILEAAGKHPYPFTSLGSKTKQKGKVDKVLPCDPEVDFTTSCLPTQFSFLQTIALFRSAPGRQITLMYFIPQRRKSHKEKGLKDSKVW